METLSSPEALVPSLPTPVGEEPPRGVRPRILLTQVRNTMPFLFGPGCRAADTRYGSLLRRTAEGLNVDEAPVLEHAAYFELCLAAHWATVATFVPTDVDNQIRFRLWHPSLPDETIFEMTDLTEEAQNWDPTPVSGRCVGEDGPRVLSGHDGEWFSVAAGSYGALRRRSPRRMREMREKIIAEVEREAAVFRELHRRGDGLALLRAATLIAHNLGDLERVMEMWNLSEQDELRRQVTVLLAEKSLHAAGELNRLLMADENHRHFALRGPKCLRQSPAYLLPLGPFFDDWGARIARELDEREVAQVVEGLVDGWEWLQKTKENKIPGSPFGYPRALGGIVSAFPGGENALLKQLPARVGRMLRSGTLRTALSMPRGRFEEQWRNRAMKAIKTLGSLA